VRTLDGLQRPINIAQEGNRDNYLIYSTVFGKVLTETNLNGAKQKTYVHDLSRKVVAIQQINYFPGQQFAGVRWEHADPSGASYMLTSHDGSIIGTTNAELDPTERAVKMFSGDSQEDDDQYGGDKGCKKPDDAMKGSTPENCAAFASEEEAMKYACENNAGGKWIGGMCRIIIREFVENSPIDPSNAENGHNTGQAMPSANPCDNLNRKPKPKAPGALKDADVKAEPDAIKVETDINKDLKVLDFHVDYLTKGPRGEVPVGGLFTITYKVRFSTPQKEMGDVMDLASYATIYPFRSEGGFAATENLDSLPTLFKIEGTKGSATEVTKIDTFRVLPDKGSRIVGSGSRAINYYVGVRNPESAGGGIVCEFSGSRRGKYVEVGITPPVRIP
jgi:hypothetical protein